MNTLALVFRSIDDASRRLTANARGGLDADHCAARAEQLAGMLELAGRLGLPLEFIEALNEHYQTLTHAAQRFG